MDKLARAIISAIEMSGAIKAGPIPSKGKRIIFCYKYNNKTIEKLMTIRTPKKVDVEIIDY